MQTMSDLGFEFNANDVEPSRPAGDPFPNGKYVMAIVESETKKTKAGTGMILNLTFEVFEGEYKSRKMWVGLNVKNPSPEAQKIALAELSAICRATGVMELANASQLHNIPLVVDTKIKQDAEKDEDGEYKYPPKNVPKGYYKLDGSAVTSRAPKATPAAAKGPLIAPWAKTKQDAAA
jgi:hypothetical protein